MKYKHKWEVLGDPGMYDTLYQCTVCEEKNMESADSMATWNPKYGCVPPKEQHHIKRLIPLTPETGFLDLPNGCTIKWKLNEEGGRTYTSDEMGYDVVVWDTALIDDSTILAAMTHEAVLQRTEQYWAERRAKNGDN